MGPADVKFAVTGRHDFYQSAMGKCCCWRCARYGLDCRSLGVYDGFKDAATGRGCQSSSAYI
jgi:hypothetical protein